VGGALGAILALLSSPRNGKDMRATLKQGSRKLYDGASEKARVWRAHAREALFKAREAENGI
jgi:gas vesicle protein